MRPRRGGQGRWGRRDAQPDALRDRPADGTTGQPLALARLLLCRILSNSGTQQDRMVSSAVSAWPGRVSWCNPEKSGVWDARAAIEQFVFPVDCLQHVDRRPGTGFRAG